MSRISAWIHPGVVLVLRLVLLLLLAHACMRGIFYAYNLGSNEVTLGQSLIAFLVGIRFDLATLCIVNGLALLILLVPKPWMLGSRGQRIWPLVLALVNGLFLFFNGMDVIYFGYSSKRLTHELFSLGKDIGSFGLDNFLPHWWLILMWLAISYVFFRVTKIAFQTAQRGFSQHKANPVHWAWPLLGGLLIFVAIRGGLQTRPLRPGNAFVSGSLFLGNVGLNSGYTIISSLDISDQQEIAMVPEKEAVDLVRSRIKNPFDGAFLSDEFPLVRKSKFSGPEKRNNVVFIILESFNANAKSPFLDSLKQTGWFFPNFYANGTRSMESLPALLNSIPDIFSRPLIGSSNETNAHQGIGNILSGKGYHTSFFCGGQNGTMGFDAYSSISGIRNYFGMNQFDQSNKSLTSNWGIHDNPFFQFMGREQNSFPEPFFSVFFSISNHHPFSLPGDAPAYIREGQGRPVDKTQLYTDWALKNYFAQAQREPWYANTYFIITADHCFFSPEDGNRKLIESFHIPLVVLGPDLQPRVDLRLASQVDIQPTLIDLLQLETHHASMGVSLADTSTSPTVINNMMGIVNLATDSLCYNTDFQQAQPQHVWDGEEKKWKKVKGFVRKTEFDQLTRSYYQVAGNARYQNKVFNTKWKD